MAQQEFRLCNRMQYIHRQMQLNDSRQDSYWSKSLRIVVSILLVWSFISLGCGIVFREWLDTALPPIGGAPFGFWMAQQGSILGFLILLVVYMLVMNRLDRKHGYDSGDGK